jgi:hypothetical protein
LYGIKCIYEFSPKCILLRGLCLRHEIVVRLNFLAIMSSSWSLDE